MDRVTRLGQPDKKREAEKTDLRPLNIDRDLRFQVYLEHLAKRRGIDLTEYREAINREAING